MEGVVDGGAKRKVLRGGGRQGGGAVGETRDGGCCEGEVASEMALMWDSMMRINSMAAVGGSVGAASGASSGRRWGRRLGWHWGIL